MRPRHAMQCLGRYPEANERMRKAWALNLKHSDPVWIITKDGRHSEWQFAHYTQAGARLFCRIEGRYYDRLISWDKGDTIYASQADMNVFRMYNVIMKQARLKLELEKLEAEGKSILAELEGLKK